MIRIYGWEHASDNWYHRKLLYSFTILLCGRLLSLPSLVLATETFDTACRAVNIFGLPAWGRVQKLKLTKYIKLNKKYIYINCVLKNFKNLLCGKILSDKISISSQKLWKRSITILYLFFILCRICGIFITQVFVSMLNKAFLIWAIRYIIKILKQENNAIGQTAKRRLVSIKTNVIILKYNFFWHKTR